MKKLVFACGILLATLSAPVLAASNLTIKFTGDCSDCSGQVTATLVLKNFSLNGVNPTLSTANLVSFTYDGSNLLAPFTTLPESSLGGNLTDPASPDPDLVGLSGIFFVNAALPGGVGRIFNATSHGGWSITPTNGGAPEDFGGNAVFTLESGVPEVASWAMFIGGFGLVGGTLRRQRTKVGFA
jgi:hypothetical protein